LVDIIAAFVIFDETTAPEASLTEVTFEFAILAVTTAPVPIFDDKTAPEAILFDTTAEFDKLTAVIVAFSIHLPCVLVDIICSLKSRMPL
jgi:hypothetical protein